ncbi:hypothetical protein S40285_09442 [Stachybotrys chlorohalonatus IBT 40285]|uniref:FAD-binding PCMH-type domain-containing protein n=1 Tax=Stachybotrys chlorohalonatus (strain IBT 40285) TaxID=1283841 RepID=A0A084Q821_STAC4|nr:hypothetical protein S40285_09442 [Stachybotrys chlorohalonata IBT 40285]
MIFSLLSFGLLATRVLAQAEEECGGPQDLRSLLLSPANNWSARTDITFPDDGDVFNNVTERWSIFSQPTYVAAISPINEDDVVRAVRFARANNIEFLATGGRHGYVPGFGRLQRGLAIDLSNLNSVYINETAETMTIGGGVRARDVTGPVSAAGFELPLGGCSCPGFVGVTIGGGITNWLGIHGLIIDVLQSVRLVTADGRIVIASETENAELFWGIRGAGSNFGIIVEATYRLSRPTNNNEILIVDTAFPAYMNVSYYNALAELLARPDARLTTNSLVNYNPEYNMTMIMGNFHWLGPHDEGMALLAPLLDLQPVLLETHTVPWNEFHHATLYGRDAQNCIPGTIRLPYGAMTRNVSVPTLLRSFERISRMFNEFPGTRGSALVYHSYAPEAAQSFPDESTAYAWRDAQQYMYVLLNWTPGDCATESGANAAAYAIRADFAETSGYDGLASYTNFAHGDETIEEIYGVRKLPQLAAIKATWDPDNVFKFHFPLPTSYP